MTSRIRFTRVFTLLGAILILLALVSGATADSLAVNFEAYSLGTVHGQDGWSSSGAAGGGCAVYDHAVVANIYGYASFGSKSLRVSNAVTSGCFSDHTFSKSLVDEAGETSAVNGGMSGGTRQPYFEAQWDFASTVPAAQQPGLSVTASPDRGDGARMSWVQMADQPGGLEVNFYDYDRDLDPTCTTGDGFVFTNVASGLSRAVPHTIRITMQFVDGIDNDVVKVYVDGVLKHTGQSWEDYFRDCEANPTRPVDSILFRTGGTAAPATAGNGFVIDNLSQFSGAVPCTTICYVDAAGGSNSNGGTSPADALLTIQKGIDMVEPGGEVRVLPGTYTESPSIPKSLTLLSTAGRDLTTIDLQTGPTYLGALTIGGADVTVQGFTIEGFDAVGAGLASTNVLVNTTPTSVVLMDNRFKVGQIGVGSNGDDGFGILTTYTTSSDVASLVVENSEFMPVGAAGGRRAFYINPGVDVFQFVDNTITGNFTASSLTQAKNGLVEDNTLTGTGTSRGFGTWGYPDPTVYGATIFRGNIISDVVNGITIFGSENVTVTKNTFTGNDRAVYVAEDDPFDLSTIHINRNSISGNDMGVENWYTTDVDAICNWWGAADGPGPVGPGSGDSVSAFVAFGPWLKTSNLAGSCFAGSAFVSPLLPGTVEAIAYGKEDVLKYDAGSDTWSLFFDGSAYGLTMTPKWRQNVNSIYVPDPDSPVGMVLSFWHNRRPVPGIAGYVYGQDLVEFNGTDFDMYFDGSDVGLTVATAEKIDSLHILPGAMSPIGAGCDAYLLISTQGAGKVPNHSGGILKFKGADVLGFCATNLGYDTTGLWHLVVNGAAEGMPPNSTDSLSANADGSVLYLTTRAAFNVDSASGGHSMVYVFDRGTGEFSGPIFSAPDAGLTQKVDALDVNFD